MYYVIAKDSFMSGWGKVRNGISWYAIECETYSEAVIVRDNFEDRPEMKAIKILKELPTIADTDNLNVGTRETASRWYEPGAFSK